MAARMLTREMPASAAAGKPTLLLVFCFLAGPAAAADLTVDVAAPFKAVDHAASGSLYGIAGEGWPADKWIAAISPKNFTQMAPGGQQLPNGERQPVGDALTVAPIAARAGATVTIRMPDTFPSFPYVWRGDGFWFDKVDEMVRATIATDPPNIYAYEIWNEPDWNWKPGWGDFNEIWERTYKAIRDLDRKRPIMGPSISKWDETWMRGFLAEAKARGVLPDIVSWHELDPRYVDDLTPHVAAYRRLEDELGIGPLPISINEYGSPREAAVPGALTRYVARLERAGVDTANLAFWHKPGRLADLVAPKAGGRGPATDAEPTGAFWVYKWYGDMTGDMVTVTPEKQTGPVLDGFASFDPASRTVRLVVGGEAGDHRVTFRGLEYLGDSIVADIDRTDWTGTDGTLAEPFAVERLTMPAPHGEVVIPLHATDASDAFLMRLMPAADAPEWNPSPTPFTFRLEAEDAAMDGAIVFRTRTDRGNLFANKVSGNAYVGLLPKANAALTFSFDVPGAGRYELSFGYSNGLAGTAEYHLSVNGAPPTPIAFTPTQARELIDQSKVIVDLPAGSSTVTLATGPNSPKVPLVPSEIEVDYLDVTAVGARGHKHAEDR